MYADDQGRTLDEAEGVDDFPELPVPIPETQATVEPGDGTYSTKKVALERILLDTAKFRQRSCVPARSTAEVTGWDASGTS